MHDEFTLLCERCGYVIEGLEPDGNCPECGKPIAESLPEARPGSLWQRKRCLSTWVSTAHEVLRHPRAVWDTVRSDEPCEPEDQDPLFILNTCVGAGIGAVLSAIPHLGLAPGRGTAVEASLSLAVSVYFSAVIGWVVLLILTVVERLGIRLFGRMHKRRITVPISRTIIGHASYGWLIAGVGVGFGHMLGMLLTALSQHIVALRWELIYMSPWLLPILGFFAGLLVFETLTWLGVLNMRYANRARPDATADEPNASNGKEPRA